MINFVNMISVGEVRTCFIFKAIFISINIYYGVIVFISTLMISSTILLASNAYVNEFVILEQADILGEPTSSFMISTFMSDLVIN